MRLTLHTDYALRVLLYLALKGEPATIAEIATRYRISRNHLMKVVRRLAQLGHVATTRGRAGGLVLGRDPGEITVGAVVRATEDSLCLVECFDDATNTCPIAPACRLKRCLGEALDAYFSVLDGYSLADLARRGRPTARLLGLDPPAR